MDIIAKHNDIPIAVIGDVHGEWDLITNRIKKYNLDNIIIFQAGDFGVGFNYNNPVEPKKENKRLAIMNNSLKKRNIFLYVVRGNHDNPSFFDGDHNFSNIIFMQDYDVVQIGEYMVLGIGGSTSVDRKENPNFKDYRGKIHGGRREGIDWWPLAEKVAYNEEKLAKIAGVDMVVMHTAPSFIFPPVLGSVILKWCQYDSELKDELIAEREVVAKIYNKLNEFNFIRFWYYGHFHNKNQQRHDITEFRLLDIGEFAEVRFGQEEDSIE